MGISGENLGNNEHQIKKEAYIRGHSEALSMFQMDKIRD